MKNLFTTNLLISICSLLALLQLFSAPFIMAAETTFDLQKQIKSDFTLMEKTNKEQEAKAQAINREIKTLVTELTNIQDLEKKDQLRKEYFKKRAQHLKAEASRVIEIEAALSRIARNMALLENEVKRSLPGDHVKGLQLSDTAHIKATLKGMANILSPLQKLRYNDPMLNNMALTLTNLDMGYRTFFRPGSEVSLTNQITYLEDLHAYVYSVKLLLRQEANYLKSNVYYMMRDGIVRVINDFQKNFYTTTFKNFENEHEMDEKVIGPRVKTEKEEFNNSPDLNSIGNWN